MWLFDDQMLQATHRLFEIFLCSHVTSEESASQLSSSVEQLKLTSPQHKIQESGMN